MPRKLTRNSLNKLRSNNSEEFDIIAREIIYLISICEITMDIQPTNEDDEYIYTDYYGEHKEYGITAQCRKKLNGINSIYTMTIETDETNILYTGPFGAKCWRTCIVQNKNLSNSHNVSQSTIQNLMDSLGITNEE